ncbi:Uncharacterised protein [Chlamydia trachomatis]|nr:Uncharacterised protein [Chlamydia trachomatis]
MRWIEEISSETSWNTRNSSSVKRSLITDKIAWKFSNRTWAKDCSKFSSVPKISIKDWINSSCRVLDTEAFCKTRITSFERERRERISSADKRSCLSCREAASIQIASKSPCSSSVNKDVSTKT